MFAIKLVIKGTLNFFAGVSHMKKDCYSKTFTFFRCLLLLTNFQSDITNPKVKLNIFVLYCELGNAVPMVTKLVLEMQSLCNKNEISYVK